MTLRTKKIICKGMTKLAVGSLEFYHLKLYNCTDSQYDVIMDIMDTMKWGLAAKIFWVVARKGKDHVKYIDACGFPQLETSQFV